MLTWQYEWAGVQLQNRRILVCPRCLDDVQPQLRAYSPPADPVPVRDPRPELSDTGEIFYERDDQGNYIVSDLSQGIVIEP